MEQIYFLYLLGVNSSTRRFWACRFFSKHTDKLVAMFGCLWEFLSSSLYVRIMIKSVWTGFVVFGQTSAVKGGVDKAQRLFRASLMVSVVGWIVGTILWIVAIILLVEMYGSHTSSSSSYKPYYYTYYYY